MVYCSGQRGGEWVSSRKGSGFKSGRGKEKILEFNLLLLQLYCILVQTFQRYKCEIFSEKKKLH